MSLLGERLEFRIEAPARGTNILATAPVFVTVSTDDVEIPDASALTLTVAGRRNVESLYNLGADTLIYTVTEDIQETFSNDAFNGFVFVDVDDDIQPFHSLTIGSQSGFTGLSNGDLSVAANEFAVNAAGVGITQGATVTFEIGFRHDGDAAGNVLTGGRGDDVFFGQGGDDWITTGRGSDTVDGGAGSDMVSLVDAAQGVTIRLDQNRIVEGADETTLTSVENATGSIHGDFIQGDAGDNRLRGLGNYDWFVGSDGNDRYEGGDGRDMISYVGASGGVEVDLGAQRGLSGQAAGDVYDSIERATGSIFADLFHGSDGRDDFRGLGDYDWFVGSEGGDSYEGGTGDDTVSYAAALQAGVIASLLLGRGSDGQAAGDVYDSIERLTGSSQDDLLTGDHGRNVLRGLYGEDTLIGNGGVDRLYGGGSDDYIDGGDDWDIALYDHDRADYTVIEGTAGVTVAHNVPGGEGTDSVFNVEALQFADQLLYL